MIYRFTIISDEVDDFVREIQIDPEATFYDFHEAILKSAGYTNDQMTSFFICDDDWEKEKEITLEEMDDNPSTGTTSAPANAAMRQALVAPSHMLRATARVTSCPLCDTPSATTPLSEKNTASARGNSATSALP